MATSRARRAFRATLVGVVLAFANLLPVQNAHADQVISTPDNSTNSVGQPVKASATFTVFPDRVLVRLTNHTQFLKSPEQALRGVSFRVRTNKPLEGHLGKSAAKVRMITPDGIKDSKDAIDVPWRVRIEGSTVHIESPGRKFGLLADPPPQGNGSYPQAEPGLTDASNNPYLSGTMVMEVVFPGTPLTYGITEVFFIFETAISVTSVDRSLSSPTANGGNELFELPPGGTPPADTGVPLVPGEEVFVPEGPFTPVIFPPLGPPEDTNGNPVPPPAPPTDSRSGGDTPKPPLSNGPEPQENPGQPTEPLPTANLPEIPEPASLAILASGLAWCLLRRSR